MTGLANLHPPLLLSIFYMCMSKSSLYGLYIKGRFSSAKTASVAKQQQEALGSAPLSTECSCQVREKQWDRYWLWEVQTDSAADHCQGRGFIQRSMFSFSLPYWLWSTERRVYLSAPVLIKTWCLGIEICINPLNSLPLLLNFQSLYLLIDALVCVLTSSVFTLLIVLCHFSHSSSLNSLWWQSEDLLLNIFFFTFVESQKLKLLLCWRSLAGSAASCLLNQVYNFTPGF